MPAGPVHITQGRLNVAAIEARLKRSIAPAMLLATQVAADTAARYLKERVRVSYNFGGRIRHKNPVSKQNYKNRTLYQKRASMAGEYPRKRTGSLLASISASRAVKHYNVYSASFGVRDNVLRNTQTRAQRNPPPPSPGLLTKNTLWEKRAARAREQHKRISRPPTLPTLYSWYLEHGAPKHNLKPRKLTRAAWNAILRNGMLKAALKKALSGPGSKTILRGGRPIPTQRTAASFTEAWKSGGPGRVPGIRIKPIQIDIQE